MTIKIIYPNYFRYYGVAYTCLSIAETMDTESNCISVLGIASDKNFNHNLYSNALNGILKKIAIKLLSPKMLIQITQLIFLRTLKKEDIVYLWPGVTSNFIEKIKKKGCLILSENINTHQRYAKQILSKEYKELNLPQFTDIKDSEIEEEDKKNTLADYIYSPSPFVTKSLLESGVPIHKILDTSYGWSSSRTKNNFDMGKDPQKRFNVLFVGYLGIRKGLHLLIDIWKNANIDGKLIIAGKFQDESFKFSFEDFFQREDVEYHGYVADISQLYSQCDVFVVPTLEEGGPMVTYEAMAHGLPVIASPMGAGRIMRNKIDGFIVDPHDQKEWITSISALKNDKELINRFSKNSYLQAQNYTWEKVGSERINLLQNKLKIN